MNDQNDLVQSFQDKLPVQPIVTPLTNKCSNQPQKNKAYYSGKFFSILGDSISTLAGFNHDGYKLFYYGENSRRANVQKAFRSRPMKKSKLNLIIRRSML